MGQYYAIGNASKRETISKDGCGAKLMETSWVNNSAIGELYKHLMDDWYGDMVVNIGDYAADDEDSAEKLKKICNESNTEKAEDLYCEIREKWAVVNENKDDNDWVRRGDLGVIYGVNLDKKEYIDLNILPINDIYKFKEDNLNLTSESLYIVDPIALLIAVGNGMGGGDYRWGNNIEEVGRWAGDRIGIVEHCPPEGYAEIKPDFKENEDEYLGHALCSEFPIIDFDREPESLLDEMYKLWEEKNPIFYLQDGKLVDKPEDKSSKDLEDENKKLLAENEKLKTELSKSDNMYIDLVKDNEATMVEYRKLEKACLRLTKEKVALEERIEGIKKIVGDIVDLSEGL